ncbi:MAG: twin-arginine translocase TatA/TatE family subunit [Anaerolineales bacterium]|nr:twin-arginine translocase TatA/TatE family subunit [Anaerolineales bacterium]
MEFLGIGPLEILIIVLAALVLLGPKDMAKAGRMIGRSLRKVVLSPQWRMITETSKEIRKLPNRLIREAGLDEFERDLDGLKKTTTEIQEQLNLRQNLSPDLARVRSGSLQPTENGAPAVQETEHTIAPPRASSQDLSPWLISPGEDQPSQEGAAPDISPWVTPPGTSSTRK